MFVYARLVPDYDLAQRSVLCVLLEAHPRLLDVGELDNRLPDVPRVREALRVLVDDGLGDEAGRSRRGEPRRSALRRAPFRIAGRVGLSRRVMTAAP